MSEPQFPTVCKGNSGGKTGFCEEMVNLALTMLQTRDILKQSKDFSVELQGTFGALHPYINVCK